MHMYATLSMGGSGQSHKKVDESRSWVLNMYYSNNVSSLECRAVGIELIWRLVESTFHPLRHERALLHCAISPFFLEPEAFAAAPQSD